MPPPRARARDEAVARGLVSLWCPHPQDPTAAPAPIDRHYLSPPRASARHGAASGAAAGGLAYMRGRPRPQKGDLSRPPVIRQRFEAKPGNLRAPAPAGNGGKSNSLMSGGRRRSPKVFALPRKVFLGSWRSHPRPSLLALLTKDQRTTRRGAG